MPIIDSDCKPMQRTTMKSTKSLVALLAPILLYGCDRQIDRMNADARVCDKALETGQLETAADYCRRALGDTGASILSPRVKSERLLKLGSILRQQARFQDAKQPVAQSLEIEERISAPDSAAVAKRLVELSLILAGQMAWEQGVTLLERALPGSDKLTGRDRETAANVFRHYAGEMKGGGREDLMRRFEAKARALKDSEPS
jgi:hypothetical protein